MKAFIAGVVVAVVLAGASAVVLKTMGFETADTFATDNVRL